MTQKFAWRALTLIIGLAVAFGVIALPVATPQLHIEAHPASAQNCSGSWEARYYNDTNFSNLVWVDCILPDGNGWLEDSFSNQFIPTTNFTATYQRMVNFDQTGIYVFDITVEDGIRVYVNGLLVVDAWGDSAGPREITQQVSITQPIALVYVEYLMTGTDAELSFHWFLYSTEPDLLVASAVCNGPDLEVTITEGDGPFNITASAGINTPVNGAGTGTTTINGPEKWDDLTITETTGDLGWVNLGQFKCRSTERPVPVWPAHQSHITSTYPLFSWTAITDANDYRVFVFDDGNPSTRTVDIRQNSGGSTSMQLSTPLPIKRLFWRVRGRQNRIWSWWSIRFTLFIDPPVLFDVPAAEFAIETPPTQMPVPTNHPSSDGSAPPERDLPPTPLAPPPTQLPPPNSR